jgi:hypothetical protein
MEYHVDIHCIAVREGTLPVPDRPADDVHLLVPFRELLAGGPLEQADVVHYGIRTQQPHGRVDGSLDDEVPPAQDGRGLQAGKRAEHEVVPLRDLVVTHHHLDLFVVCDRIITHQWLTLGKTNNLP